MLIKVFATGITLGAGGNGGNFAPSLFVGSYLGFSVAYLCNLIGIAKLPIGNFTLVGMARYFERFISRSTNSYFLNCRNNGRI